MNKYYKILLFVFASSVLITLYSCGGATEFEEDAAHHKPIKNTANLGMIGFKKAVSDIPPSTIVGGFFTGWAKVLRQEYYASGFVEDRFQRTYEDVVVNELNDAGYQTISKNVVFDTIKTNPRFLVGAIIKDGKLNYYKSVTENNADALMDIMWQVYDTQEQKIIFAKQELGTFRDAESDLYAYRESVRISFRNFLSEKLLVQTFSQYMIANPNKP